MTPAEVEALRADIASRIVMTGEATGDTFTVTLVEVEPTPAEAMSHATDQLAELDHQLAALDDLAAQGLSLDARLRGRHLDIIADLRLRRRLWSLDARRRRLRSLAAGLDQIATRLAATLDALVDQIATSLSALSVGSPPTSIAPPRSLRPVPVWPAPPLAPPARSVHRDRWERPD